MANDDSRLNRIADPSQLKASLMQEKLALHTGITGDDLRLKLLIKNIRT